MLTILGWIDGITASCVVIIGVIVGLFFCYRSKKSEAKLLMYLGLANTFAGLMFLGVFFDFLVVLFTGVNLDNANGIVGILSYVWFAPVIISAMYLGGELLSPEKKWYIVSIFLVLSIIFEAIIILTPLNSFEFVETGDDLIDYNINLATPAGILMACMLIPLLIFLGFGFLRKSLQSTGELRRKFLFLSIGSICFCIFGLLEGLTAPGITLIFVRIGFLSSFWFMYYGL